MVNFATMAIDGWQDGEVREMNGEMMQLTMHIVAKALFDADRNSLAGQAERVGQAVHIFQKMIDHDLNSLWVPPGWIPTQRNRRQHEAKRTIDVVIEQIIAARRSQAVDGMTPDHGDLLSMLMQARDEHGAGLSDQDLRDELVTIFLAGHETTSNALVVDLVRAGAHP